MRIVWSLPGENVQNPVKRALSIESILSQKMMIHSTVSRLLLTTGFLLSIVTESEQINRL